MKSQRLHDIGERRDRQSNDVFPEDGRRNRQALAHFRTPLGRHDNFAAERRKGRSRLLDRLLRLRRGCLPDNGRRDRGKIQRQSG